MTFEVNQCLRPDLSSNMHRNVRVLTSAADYLFEIVTSVMTFEVVVVLISKLTTGPICNVRVLTSAAD